MSIPRYAWCGIHLASVYISSRFLTPALGGQAFRWIYRMSFPIEKSSFQFFYSHLFMLSILPAICLAIVNIRYEQKTALFVWLLPSTILAYKFFTFHSGIFQSQIGGAYHEYFSSNFVIPAYRNYREMFQGVNSDLLRGAEQARFTSPFFASIAYTIVALIGWRVVRR